MQHSAFFDDDDDEAIWWDEEAYIYWCRWRLFSRGDVRWKKLRTVN